MTPMLPFTGHNIALPDGTETLPGTPLVAENGICQAALRIMRALEIYTVADPGCLEGGYAAAFAQSGYGVTGVEARDQNFTRCEYVAERLNLPRVKFIRDDARNLASYGIEFDAVFCAGLLYHLDDPDAFLRMLGTVTNRLLIIQTHYAPEPDTVHEGRRGRWHADNPGDGDPWGSHRNDRSFRMSGPDLLQAIRDAGFPVVLQQFDYLPDIAAGSSGTAGPSNPCGGADRGMFIGIKP